MKRAIEIGDRCREGRACGNLGNAYQSLGDYQKAIEYHEKHLKIGIETGDQAGEGNTFHNIGTGYISLEQFEYALDNFVCAVEAFNALGSSWKFKDN